MTDFQPRLSARPLTRDAFAGRTRFLMKRRSTLREAILNRRRASTGARSALRSGKPALEPKNVRRSAMTSSQCAWLHDMTWGSAAIPRKSWCLLALGLALLLGVASPGATAKRGAELVQAADYGGLPGAKKLLAQGANVNARTKRAPSGVKKPIDNQLTEIVRVVDDELVRAATRGDLPRMKTLLERGADVNADLRFGGRPLTVAAYHGHVEVVRLLLAKEADVDAKDRVGKTALMLAAERRDTPVVKLLLENGADVSAVDKNGRTALIWAAGMSDHDPSYYRKPTERHFVLRLIRQEPGQFEVAELLLEHGADPNAKDRGGWTPVRLATGDMSGGYVHHPELLRLLRVHGAELTLASAAWLGDKEEVQRLLETGTDVNAKNRQGLPPVIAAAKKGNGEVLKLLVDSGADPNVEDNNGLTPLMWAADRGHLETARILLENGADVNAVTEYGATALKKAIESPERALVKLLLDHGAEANASLRDGSTPLMWAAIAGQASLAKLLLERGADVDAKADDGATALMLAAVMHSSEVVELLKAHNATVTLPIAAMLGDQKAVARLIDAGADVNERDRQGWTPLMYSARNGHADLVRLLLNNGADVNLKDSNGGTALMNACVACDLEVIKLLLDAGADVNAEYWPGLTALDNARENCSEGIVDFLKAHGAND